jgi:hypothetical protein
MEWIGMLYVLEPFSLSLLRQDNKNYRYGLYRLRVVLALNAGRLVVVEVGEFKNKFFDEHQRT